MCHGFWFTKHLKFSHVCLHTLACSFCDDDDDGVHADYP